MRLVQLDDTAQILDVYDPYVKNTAITFEYETPSLDVFRDRIEAISQEYPYIVCSKDSKIIGYAYAHKHMERAAYQWNAELSIYIHSDFQRLGLGKKLYGSILEILKIQNIQNVYGCVTSPNTNSEKIHEYFGFKKIGTYHSTGYKHGKWHDVVWFEKKISFCHNPKPFIPITELNCQKIIGILNHGKI